MCRRGEICQHSLSGPETLHVVLAVSMEDYSLPLLSFFRGRAFQDAVLHDIIKASTAVKPHIDSWVYDG